MSITMMEIHSFKDDSYQNSDKDFIAQVNPDSFTRTIKVKVDKEKNNKRSAKKVVYEYDGETYSFELTFDGTGALGKDREGDVSEKITKLLDVLYKRGTDTKGQETKLPNLLQINYCGELFYCSVSESITIKYTLFSREGKPLRAKVTCSFTSNARPADNKKDKDEKPKPKPKPKPLQPQPTHQPQPLPQEETRHIVNRIIGIVSIQP